MSKWKIGFRPFVLAVTTLGLSSLVVSPRLAAAAENSTPDEAAAATVFEHFITRDGDQLVDGDKPFRFVGANMPGLVLPYDYWLGIPERMVLPTPWEQEDGLKSLRQMGAGCVRTWNLPIREPNEKKAAWHYVWGPGEFNEEAFKTIDHLLALANKQGVRVMLDLTADCGDYLGGVGTYAAHRGKPRAAFFTDPQIKKDFKATIQHVLTRVNTVSGVPYKNDKAILAWQFGNEMDRTARIKGFNVVDQTAWQAEMAAYMKELDPNHLIAYGKRFFPENPDPNIDIITYHYYGNVKNWAKMCDDHRSRTKGKRPFVIGEFGLTSDVGAVRAMLDTAVANGTAGAMVWSMYFHHRDGGFWWHAIPTDGAGFVFSYHWPGFPIGESIKEAGILALLREKAFEVQGRTVPPLEKPEASELLPFEDLPMFSWRGSAGAEAYDVQRAAKTNGPWSTIAENLNDSDIAYRPLFSDTTVRPGETWFYRVIARNAAGESSASNVVGPVAVKQVCMVDELKDFSVAAHHSDGLKPVNVANSYFGEYLYRALGDTGESLVYELPLEITSVKLWTWGAPGKAPLALYVSRDGENYEPLATDSEERHYTSNKGGRKATEIQVQANIGPGFRFLKCEWLAKSELDRVEIVCGSNSDRLPLAQSAAKHAQRSP